MRGGRSKRSGPVDRAERVWVEFGEGGRVASVGAVGEELLHFLFELLERRHGYVSPEQLVEEATGFGAGMDHHVVWEWGIVRFVAGECVHDETA